MRATAFYAPTSKEPRPEARGDVERLLISGGFCRRLATGPLLLPLGYRVLSKVLGILKREIVGVGALEVVVPGLVPLETWSAFVATIGDAPAAVLARDARQRELVVCPRYGTLLAVVAGCEIASYRDLPRKFFAVDSLVLDGGDVAQAGLLRANSLGLRVITLDTTLQEQQQSVREICEATVRGLERLGLRPESLYVTEAPAQKTTVRRLLAPSAGGGQLVLHCPGCGHTAAPDDCAGLAAMAPPVSAAQPAMQLVQTPGARTVPSVCAQLGTTPDRLVKTLIYWCDGSFVAGLVRGDRQLSETKLGRHLGAVHLRLALPEEIRDLTGAQVGFSGPVGLPADVAVIADHEVAAMHDCVLGANQTDMHLVHAAVGRDFVPDEIIDLRMAGEGDVCPTCQQSALEAVWTAELARAELFPTATAAALRVQYADTDGQSRPMFLGLCDVDLGACLTAIVEQHHDRGGIAWPAPVAPFDVAILLLDTQSTAQVGAAEDIYVRLRAAGHDVLLDDRDMRPGAKFYHADLVGCPVVIVVGKRLVADGLVEVRRRSTGDEVTATVRDVVSVVSGFLNS